MEQKFIFSVAGLGDILKSRVYRLVAEDGKDFQGLTQPLYGSIAGNGAPASLSEVVGRNIIVPLVLRANGQMLQLPEAVVSITKKKRIVSTTVVGGQGTVKEYVGDDDMSIDITVGVVAVDGQRILDEYPEDAMYTLIDILDARVVEVWSPFLQLFDLDGGEFKMVVTDYTVLQSTHTNRQAVSIQAVSDFDYMIFNEES
jgi:hypothetical protein